MQNAMTYLAALVADSSVKWYREPPASEEDIADLQAEAGWAMPADYLAFLRLSNGGSGELGIKPGWFLIWPAWEVVSANQEHWTEDFFAPFYGFGSNGGGEMLCFNVDEVPPDTVYMVPFMGEAKDALVVADNFLAVVAAMGRSLPDEDDKTFSAERSGRQREAEANAMSQWRRETIERFPELARDIAYAEDAYAAWWELYNAFVQSYNNYPFPLVNHEFAERMYTYAHWCLHHPSPHVRVGVIERFYMQLPEQDRIREDMPRWLSQEDFDLLTEDWRDRFKTDEAFAAWEQAFQHGKEALATPASRRKAKKRR